MSKISKLICLILSLIFVATLFVGVAFQVMSASNATTAYSGDTAKAMCVMEASSKRVLFSKNMNQKLAMASTTKIMTAITAIENCPNLDENFKISPRAVGVSGTSIYLRKDETMSMKDLLYGLMLVSGNDASVAIGEHVGGDLESFVGLMNDMALKIGAKDSHFDNTHGLDSKTHYTTAHDLALIASYAMNNETFKQIVSTKNTKIVSGEGKSRYLRNKNKLLSSLDGCNGVKTGFTDDAGRCYVSSCQRDGMTVVSVVLNCGPMFEECAALSEKAFNEFKLYDLSENYDFTNEIAVCESRAKMIKIGAKDSAFYPLRQRELANIKYVYKLPENVTAPIKAGEKIGKILIFNGNNLLFSENIYTMENIKGNTVWDKLKSLASNW